ncbi:MAG: sterol desaturase family protein [Proteobacteria bacterium]|nr:sterol desaturase family protein [Desulfocapsa sp.]MBU3943633.1 sterol desaturase family protein [Pseudomonadota bacterium]MBU3983144.1 sterol desaturase family protein [Pseudomonadota bacterium]MBU4028701.1 sterol desaturase family protein [Pseudomonadota bacterium]MBU4042900.1 sterol desaturase family protein [Pseudomonadota bacterium]
MENEAAIQLGFFFGILVLVALGELLFPRRALTTSKTGRWLSNLGVVAVDTFTVRLLFPIIAVQVAGAAQEKGWGLLNVLNLPDGLSFLLAMLALDLIVYLQHVMFHAVPLLWRVHMMHHADLDIDVTTGLRFHPIEIVLSMLIKMTAIAALGPSVLTVIIFEIILNGTAMFNHGNLKLPLSLDRTLRFFVVTPDMHRVHHSVTISRFQIPSGAWCRSALGRRWCILSPFCCSSLVFEACHPMSRRARGGSGNHLAGT